MCFFIAVWLTVMSVAPFFFFSFKAIESFPFWRKVVWFWWWGFFLCVLFCCGVFRQDSLIPSQAANKREPGAALWCPVRGQEAVSTGPGTGGSLYTWGKACASSRWLSREAAGSLSLEMLQPPDMSLNVCSGDLLGAGRTDSWPLPPWPPGVWSKSAVAGIN